ncbi:MAG: hypothetical protein ACYDAI_18985 [Trichloromonadaceae bacterium]
MHQLTGMAQALWRRRENPYVFGALEISLNLASLVNTKESRTSTLSQMEKKMKKAFALTTLFVLLGSGIAFAGTTDDAPCSTTACACAAKATDAKTSESDQFNTTEADLLTMQRP